MQYIFKDNLCYCNDIFESVFIELINDGIDSKNNAIVGVVYRPPGASVTEFNMFFEGIMESFKSDAVNCYIMGDFNIDVLKSDTHNGTANFMDIIYRNSFLPSINRPTRITETTATIIDNIFTNVLNPSIAAKNGILYTDLSDHLPIFHISQNKICSKVIIPTSQQVITSKTLSELKLRIDSCDWTDIVQYQDTNSVMTAFNKKFKLIYNECIPTKVVSFKHDCKKPWLSNGLIKSIGRKNKLYYNYRHSTHNIKAKFEKYKMFRNKLHHLIRISEKAYYASLIENNKQNLTKIWKIINNVIGKNKVALINNRFKYNGTVITDKKDIANHFNSFFVKVGPNLARKIPSSNHNPLNYLKGNYLHSFYFHPVVEDDIRIIINALRNSSPGWDNINPKVVKYVSSGILQPFTYIVNLSLESGIFPDDLKLAKIIPLYKKGDPELFTNYRPISILSFFSKIFEKVAYNQLISYLEKKAILYDFQFGFRKGYSTEMAVSYLVSRVSEALDRHDRAISIFLDLSKAFDTVNHEILLSKLSHYGIRGSALIWFTSYITNRKQFLCFMNEESTHLDITCGVPQGSILGPLLFLIYINDLGTLCDNIFTLLFADDTSLLFTGRDLDILIDNVNATLKICLDWFNSNKLSVNLDKTNYMIFGTKSINNSPVKVNNTFLEQIFHCKFLGVWIDSKLNWKYHILNISSKLSKIIGIFKKIRWKLGKDILTQLYYTLAYPYFLYCNVIWAANYPSNLDKLSKIQKKLVRIISNSEFNAHTYPIFVNLKILRFDQINRYASALFIFKILNNFMLLILQNFFQFTSDIHRYSTRQSSNLYVPRSRTNLCNFSIKYHGALVWNSIPQNIRCSPSLYVFKSKLKTYLISCMF